MTDQATAEALTLLREVEQLQATVRHWMQAARDAQAEAERWKAQAFQPLGDNHHNALLCPHCNPEGRRFA